MFKRFNYIFLTVVILLSANAAIAEWKPEYAAQPQWVRDWYKDATLTEAAQQRLNVNWKSCCERGDVFRTEFRVNKENGDDEWWYLEKNGNWKQVPSDIIHWGETAPDKRP